MSVKPGDTVRIIAENLATVLVQELGRGRRATYIGTVVERRGDRVQVALDGRSLWFDIEALTTNLTMELQP